MEEENRKGPGLFYAVVSIATLVVAIIGATFAYFSATVNATDSEEVKGNTLDINGEGGAISLKVTRASFSDTEADSDNLVPAQFTNEPTQLANDDITNALTAKCEKDGYTGCHVWKAEVENTIVLSTVDLQLQLTTTATKKDDWSYAVFEATGDSVDALSVTAVDSKGAFSSLAEATSVKLESDLAVAKHNYYLLVYLRNQEEEQQDAEATDATGEYTGTFTIQVASGSKISASFTA